MVGLRAAVERGPSQSARSGSTGPTWVSFQSFLSCVLREQEGDQAARSHPPKTMFLNARYHNNPSVGKTALTR